MAGQPETPTYDPQVYQYEIVDPVQGGVGGIANLPLKQLADRTAYLKQRLDSLINGTLIPPTVAPLNGAAFTGSTTAPNVRPGDDSTLIANTDFVQTKDHGTVYIACSGGNLTLNQDQWGVGILVFTGTLGSAQSIVWPAIRGKWVVFNSTTGAFTLTCRSVGGGRSLDIPQGFGCAVWSDGGQIVRQDTTLVGRGEVTSADLAGTGVSPGFYALANLTVGADGRITGAANGQPTFAQIVAGLGFTPVQQGGGAGQGNNKVFFGWDGSHMKVQVDTSDLGEIPAFSDFRFSSPANAFQSLLMQLPCLGNSGRMFLQVAGVAITHSGSGHPETTTVALPVAFPTQCYGAIGCFIGTSPPASANTSSPAFQPISNTQIQISVNSISPQSGLGIVYLAIGI